MPSVPVVYKQFEEACIIKVKAGTTCPAGGDSGHGGRTVFGLENEGSTDLQVRINGGPISKVESVEIVLGGDAEASVLVDALEFALQVLKSQQKGSCDLPIKDEDFD